MNLPIQRLSYNKIGEIANNFLNKYHPDFSLPIPIEEISEQKLKIKIVQEMDLKREYDVEGFLTADLSKIFKELNINSVEKLNHFSVKLNDEEYRWLEYQAYSFASHVLVPSGLLIKALEKRLNKVPSMEAPEVLAPIIQDLPDIFQVSDAVILRRLQKEAIVKANS